MMDDRDELRKQLDEIDAAIAAHVAAGDKHLGGLHWAAGEMAQERGSSYELCPTCKIAMAENAIDGGVVRICPECGATYTERPQPARGREGR